MLADKEKGPFSWFLHVDDHQDRCAARGMLPALQSLAHRETVRPHRPDSDLPDHLVSRCLQRREYLPFRWASRDGSWHVSARSSPERAPTPAAGQPGHGTAIA